MKGLASVIGILLVSGVALAGPLEVSIGGGPATTSLDDINTSILLFNTLITHLNETLAVIPGVSGTVGTLAPMISGMALRASERYWVTDWIAVTGCFEYNRVSTATRGQYIGAETSTIDVSAALTNLSILVGSRIQFLDVGLRLAGDVTAGYFYSTLDHAVVFEIPSEYPDAISGVPPEGEGRASGGTFGVEAGLSMSYPIVDGFCIEALLAYRWATVPVLRDATATPLDFDGNGTPESASLDGLSVQIGFSLALDLSLDGEKGE
ncbi:MAG: hypothetical protein NTV92_01225 [Candidatus Bipolaricaulota bacterium]|nr:hypothetical protein [Candidatus Bipolaricaulota bacterium]